MFNTLHFFWTAETKHKLSVYMCAYTVHVYICYSKCAITFWKYSSCIFVPFKHQLSLVQQDQATWQQLLITLSRIWMSAIWLSIKNEVFKSVCLVCWVFFLGGGLEWRGRGIWRGMSTRNFSTALRYPRFLLEWPFMKHSFEYHEAWIACPPLLPPVFTHPHHISTSSSFSVFFSHSFFLYKFDL